MAPAFASPSNIEQKFENNCKKKCQHWLEISPLLQQASLKIARHQSINLQVPTIEHVCYRRKRHWFCVRQFSVNFNFNFQSISQSYCSHQSLSRDLKTNIWKFCSLSSYCKHWFFPKVIIVFMNHILFMLSWSCVPFLLLVNSRKSLVFTDILV